MTEPVPQDPELSAVIQETLAQATQSVEEVQEETPS